MRSTVQAKKEHKEAATMPDARPSDRRDGGIGVWGSPGKEALGIWGPAWAA